MRNLHKVVALIALSGICLAAQAPSDGDPAAKTGKKQHAVRTAKKVAPAKRDETAEKLRELRNLIEQQQSALQQVQQQLQQTQQQLQQTEQQLTSTQQTAQQADAKAMAVETNSNLQVQKVQADLSDVKMAVTTANQQAKMAVSKAEDLEHPLALHYKGVTITPGGFLAAESVWRQHGTGSDINTPFNSINFPGADAYHQSEFFGSGRQSRLSLLVEGRAKFAKLTGYYETDWLGTGVTSNHNQSNSYVNRMRQLYGQAAMNDGLTITGGQMWSLVTETKKGVDNRSEALPMTIDPAYHVGFSWARQYGFRVSKNFNNKVWLAASIENPETTLTAHNASANFNFGEAGVGGGLYNLNANYSFNEAPDVVIKAAFEPGFGHYEIFGLMSQFRDRVYPNATATPASTAGAYNDSRTGGGIGVNARASFVNKRLDIGLHVLDGNGVGRYGTSTLPDATVRPNGTLALLRSGQGLGTIEWHSPKIDIYGNAGVEYVGRYSMLNAAGVGVGYGVPTLSNAGCFTETLPTGGTGVTPGSAGSCTADTRNLIEGTFGFWYKPFNGGKGRIQFGPQYSYLVRNTWAGVGGAPHTIENMFFTSFRYYIP
jgi:hypothetical protein